MIWRRARVVGIAAAVAAAIAAGIGAAAQRPDETTPVIVVFKADTPFGNYVGNFAPDDRWSRDPDAWGYHNRGVAGAVQALEHGIGFRAERVYSAALQGFAASLTRGQLAAVERLPIVDYVEADGTMSIVAQTLPWGINRVDADIASVQAGNGSGSVTGVNAYIIDTGIRIHDDLNRVNRVNFTGDGQNTDCNGHGTHVAGTVGARDNTIHVVGAAPGIALTGVKVLGCNGSGSTSGVIQGVDWVTANRVRPAVANMSLGGGVSTALDDAVRRSVSAGVFYAVAAGNSGANACNSSPARAGAGTNNGIMTTAATDSSNREASWSNYGSCVDVWAPGVSILSTSMSGGTTTLSGTSMASPHVAGSGALVLRLSTGTSPASVESALRSNALGFGTTSKDGRAIRIVNVRNY